MSIPSEDAVRRFIAQNPTPPTAKDIGMALGVRKNERTAFRYLLKSMADRGEIVRDRHKAFRLGSDLPAVTAVNVTGLNIDGEVLAVPADWDEKLKGPVPEILVAPGKKGHPAFIAGDKLLVHVRRGADNKYEARAIRRLDTAQKRTVGMIVRTAKGWQVQPADKKDRNNYNVAEKDVMGAQDGDLVAMTVLSERRGQGPAVKITQVLGRADDPKAISLIAAHEMGLRMEFSQAALDETKNMTVPPLANREDLRHIPLVTIDGPDARDFDDAVFAEKTANGFHLIVAIADVGHYVKPGSALDQDAYARGNSTYFPDRVLPMLPEKLSNDLCSLRPNEDRACVGFHMWIGNDGRLQKYEPFRGLMKSVARLTYEQVQAAKDGNPDTVTGPLMEKVIDPLYAAYECLWKARETRGTLELDLPERKVLLNEKGEMAGIKRAVRLDSHKLIEEFMILANVAAAGALEKKNAPCVYRVHELPNPQKLDEAKLFIQAFGLSMPDGSITKPQQINGVLKQAAGKSFSPLVSEILLRTQSQARYSTENEGHFGLALKSYAHFTSPIRRYADLLVHRSLNGELSEDEKNHLEAKAEHISNTERLSATAERNTVDRFAAAFLAQHIGAEFAGRITGATRAGLFVKLDDTGADGFVPSRLLPPDQYVHVEDQHALIGRRSGRVFRVGASLTVKLREADGVSGNTILETVGMGGADIEGASFPRANLPRQSRGRHKGPRNR